MIGQCGLDPGVNKCPHYIKENGNCKTDNQTCCFWVQPEAKKETSSLKEPKWFEQYYKR